MADSTVDRQEVLGWHFLASDRRLQFGSRELVGVGKTYTATGRLKLCENGLHASERALDALHYAPGAVVCRVALSGEIVRGDDKLCATRRRVLAMADATTTLHEFACWCATEALEQERKAGREPDIRCWQAIEAKLRWLRGEASDSELDAARAAARDAASAAARDAAWATAWATARAAAWATAWATARAAQNAELERRLLALMDIPTARAKRRTKRAACEVSP